MRNIYVTGKGELKLKPNMTRVTIDLEGTFPEYTKTLKSSAEDTESIKSMLSSLGFERSEIKTLEFDVSTKYEDYKVKDNWKRRFVGYTYTHKLKIEFESNNDRLGKILSVLAKSSLKPEFFFTYFVKDAEAAKNLLLEKAIRDAEKKAEVLSKAAGVTLKNIQDINYSWGHINLEIAPVDRGLGCDDDSFEDISSFFKTDIVPDDIVASDTVTVVWEIE